MIGECRVWVCVAEMWREVGGSTRTSAASLGTGSVGISRVHVCYLCVCVERER